MESRWSRASGPVINPSDDSTGEAGARNPSFGKEKLGAPEIFNKYGQGGSAGHVGQDGVLTSHVAVASVNLVAWQPDQRCDELAGASS
jgi:hypothetical protein